MVIVFQLDCSFTRSVPESDIGPGEVVSFTG